MSINFSRLVSLAFTLFVALGLSAQKPLTHDDYDQWRSLRGTTIRADGQWVAYQIEPQWGDGLLEVRQVDGDKVWQHALGSSPAFTADGRFVVFTIGESKVEERNKKLEELAKRNSKGEEGGGEGSARPRSSARPSSPRAPGQGGRGGAASRAGRGARGNRGGSGGSGGRGKLAVMDLETGEVEVIGKVQSFHVIKEEPFLVYQPQKEDEDEDEGDKDGDESEKAESESGGEAPAAERSSRGRRFGGRQGRGRAGRGRPGQGEGGQPPSERPGRGGRGEQRRQEPSAEEPEVEEEPVLAQPEIEEVPSSEPPAAAGQEPQAKAEAGQEPQAKAEAGQEPQAKAEPSEQSEKTEPKQDSEPKDPLEKKRRDGRVVVVRDLRTGEERRLTDVVGYGFFDDQKWLRYHTSAKKPEDGKTYGLFAQRLDGSEQHTLVEGFADFSGFTADRSGNHFAFLSNKDDFAAEKPRSDLWLWQVGEAAAARVVHPDTAGMPAGRKLGSSVSFSRDGTAMMLTLERVEEEEDEIAILDDEKVVLDLWHYGDGLLQTMQAKGRGRSSGDDQIAAVLHRAEARVQVLGDEVLTSMRFITDDGTRAMATDSKPYERLVTWDGRYNDVWVVDTRDGTRSKVVEKLRGSASSSPTGRYLTWFGEDYRWWAIDLSTMTRRDLTGPLRPSFHRLTDDRPEPASAHGIAGWTEGDAAVLIYDEFDLWQIRMDGGAVCVTEGFGRSNGLQLRIERGLMEQDEDHEEDDRALRGELILSARNVETMATGFFRDHLDEWMKPEQLVMLDKAIRGIRKAEDADRYFFNVSTFAEYPDLWTSAPDFGDMRRLSQANPQQKDYRWGHAELVRWTNGDGIEMKGVLVKPDGFDPDKKYPLMVYFYERLSQNLHSYVAPAPGTSPNAAYYVSNGYLWFTPDIVYNEGYPGESSVKCVVSGVQHLVDQGFVDRDAIGAAGHSWGGYQTAFLVTRTNIFKAVESGAPVSNMVSAYGGIRYSSGMSRQFQYEKTQSRIGGTPWEYPMRYWENSPIFFADRVRTPVLMLHNDNDGAVPWTQGIEYFTALRRLGREVYLFNYNGEDHGLRKRQNQKDWTRRMSEYFAHHLKGEPMPQWMVDGVRYEDRESEKLPYAKSYHEVKAALEEEAVAEPVEAAANPQEVVEEPAEPEVEVGGERRRR
jgi:acetyl esterase/lipase